MLMRWLAGGRSDDDASTADAAGSGVVAMMTII